MGVFKDIIGDFNKNDIQKLNANGIFKIFTPKYTAGKSIKLATFSEGGTRLDTDQVYIFKPSYHFLSAIFDNKNELPALRLKIQKLKSLKMEKLSPQEFLVVHSN